MADTKSPIADAALDSLSVAPPPPVDAKAEAAPAEHPDQSAGQDASIAERLRRDPGSVDAKLDCGLDESMDASDPPANTMPGHGNDPAPSTGFDEAAEEALRRK